MDSLASSNMVVAEVKTLGPMGLPIGAVEAFFCAAVAMVVLRLELQRRAGTGPNLGSRQGGWYAENCKRLLKECAPEAAGLFTCLTLAAALRARGDAHGVSESDAEAWEQINSEWPLLLTADTLLSLQAMLRLVVLISVVLRAGGGAAAPLADEATCLWLFAGLARVGLLARTSVYMLDGPLGGMLPAACEVAVVPMLLVLSKSTLRRAPLTLGLVLAATVSFASRNYLALADEDDKHLADSTFMLAHTLDCLAAFAYLFRTALIDTGSRGVSTGFTHLLMPVQAGLSAYYFLQAFMAVPELVGKGLPFEALQIGNTAALGAYLGASALYFAECFDGRSATVAAV